MDYSPIVAQVRKARLSGNFRSADDIDSIANAVTSKYLNLH